MDNLQMILQGKEGSNGRKPWSGIVMEGRYKGQKELDISNQ
jgi:hypothetical protein